MKRVLCVVVLSLFMVDFAVDSFDADCFYQAQPCHTCLCGTPALPQAPATANLTAPRPAVRVAPVFDSFAGRLTDKSLFRPPRLTA